MKTQRWRVKSADVDPIYLEISYYVAPAASKPYGLLCKAMADTSYDAVARDVGDNLINSGPD
jgi:non-homologous end joining protein Ku